MRTVPSNFVHVSIPNRLCLCQDQMPRLPSVFTFFFFFLHVMRTGNKQKQVISIRGNASMYEGRSVPSLVITLFGWCGVGCLKCCPLSKGCCWLAFWFKGPPDILIYCHCFSQRLFLSALSRTCAFPYFLLGRLTVFPPLDFFLLKSCLSQAKKDTFSYFLPARCNATV